MYECSFPVIVNRISDFLIVTTAINQGIDSHLEGFTKSKFAIKQDTFMKRLYCEFDESEIPILLRRIREQGTEEAEMLADDIEKSFNGEYDE